MSTDRAEQIERAQVLLAPGERPAGQAGRVHLRGLLVPALVVAVWWAVSALGLISPRVLPAPGAVASSAWDFVFAPRRAVLGGVVEFDGAAWLHLTASLARLLGAFGLAAAVGVPLGLSLGLSRRTAALLDPLVQALRPIPIYAWLPLAFAWFGLGEGAARWLIFIGAVFPIVVATADGARRVPPRWPETARMLGTTGIDLYRRVYVPAALPSIITGLRLGLTLGWMSVIVGELTGTPRGIGVMMFAAREVGRLDRVVVGMACFALLGLATDTLVRRIGRRWTAWTPT